MALGYELREAFGCGGNRVGRGDAQNVEALATGVCGEFRFRGSGI
jgi:hypothetical protein